MASIEDVNKPEHNISLKTIMNEWPREGSILLQSSCCCWAYVRVDVG